MIAQDTGSAIVGPARGDIFVGSGDAAGLARRAHPARRDDDRARSRQPSLAPMSRKLTDEERELWDRLRQSVQPLARRAPEEAEAKRNRQAAHRGEARPVRTRPACACSAAREVFGRKVSGAGAVRGADTPAPGARAGRGRRAHRSARHAAGARLSCARRVSAQGADAWQPHRACRHRQGQGGVKAAAGFCASRCPPGCRARTSAHLVVGWEEASRRHGGGGALYVRIRRRRAAASRRLLIA